MLETFARSARSSLRAAGEAIQTIRQPGLPRRFAPHNAEIRFRAKISMLRSGKAASQSMSLQDLSSHILRNQGQEVAGFHQGLVGATDDRARPAGAVDNRFSLGAFGLVTT